jgi:hypothetical protein
MKAGLNTLTLVFPPISNQQAEWLWKDPEVREYVKGSKLYMIGQRQQAKFVNFRHVQEKCLIVFDVVCGELEMRDVCVELEQFTIGKDKVYGLSLSDDVIKLYAIDPGIADVELGDLFHWFTPDGLFMYHSRGLIKATGLDRFKQFSVFDLYYVGLSKQSDSFSRLFKDSHGGRCRILGNERQIAAEARLTDELMMFLFEVSDLQVVVHSLDQLQSGSLMGQTLPLDPAVLASDAEKAFIHIMKAKYNSQLYASYPKSAKEPKGSGRNMLTFEA